MQGFTFILLRISGLLREEEESSSVSENDWRSRRGPPEVQQLVLEMETGLITISSFVNESFLL